MKMMDSIIISGKYSSAILSSVQISLVLHSDNLYEQNSDTLYNPTLLVTNNEQIAQTKSNCFAFSFFPSHCTMWNNTATYLHDTNDIREIGIAVLYG